MKTKILKTLFVIALWSIPFGFISKTENIGEIGEVLYDTIQYLLDKAL